MMVKCDFCNNDIKKVPSHITEHNFCNYKCAGNWKKGRKRPEITGINNPFYGKHHSEEAKNKLRYERTEEHKEKIRQKAIGRPQSDITRKKRSESQLGEKNHAYVHGDSRRKYCYKFLGKNGVRERSLLFFNNKCMECNKTERENGKKLSVHHVYYRKMSCCENDEEYESGIKIVDNILYIKDKDKEYTHKIIGKRDKFAVLCNSCHAKTTTHNRLFWIRYFENKINKLYNGKSYNSKNNVLPDDIYLNTDNKNNNIKED